MTKIALVSGFSGFIGQNLGFVLKQQGYEVAPIPRNILSNPAELAHYVSSAGATHIFHLASYGNHSNQKDIDEVITTNYLKSYFLLKAADKGGVGKFINFSTSSVYGTHDAPMNENTPLDSTTFYGATKIGVEHLVKSYGEYSGMETVSIRPFSVYGEGEALHRFIPTILNSIANQKELTLYEKPVHDWIYIEDFLNGVMCASDNISKLDGGVINIGTGKQYTNKQIYDLLLEITGGKPLDVNIKDSNREYDTDKFWVADNTLLKSFGWEQQSDIRQGLTATYEYYKGILDLEAEREKLVGADAETILNTLAEKFGTGWEDIPAEEEPKIIV